MNAKPRTAQEMIVSNLIVKHYAGSRAYGTSLPTSDTDFRGVFIADPLSVRTPFYRVEEVEDTTEEDTKIYELSQFMKLVVDCNPNVIETLWVDRADIVHTTPAYELLREAAPKLLSSKIAFTTSGYALSQLKRIKGHNKWINNPQSVEMPRQVDYVSLVHNFTDAKVFKVDLNDYHYGHRLVPYERNIFGVYKVDGFETFSDEGLLNIFYDASEDNNFFVDEKQFLFWKKQYRRLPLFIVKFNKSNYEEDKLKWEQYWTWKKNRNEVRSDLEEKFGYDTKHAMHLVRLLRMGVEALTEGVIKVKRPDAQELLAVRNGEWTYEQVVEYAEKMDHMVREDLYLKTSLPKRPDLKLAADLVLQAQDLLWMK